MTGIKRYDAWKTQCEDTLPIGTVECENCLNLIHPDNIQRCEICDQIVCSDCRKVCDFCGQVVGCKTHGCMITNHEGEWFCCPDCQSEYEKR